MKTTQHTLALPLQYAFIGTEGDCVIEHHDPELISRVATLRAEHICEEHGTAEEYARFIVTACNAHYELLETVRWIASQQNLFFAECAQAEEIVQRCKAAIAKTQAQAKE